MVMQLEQTCLTKASLDLLYHNNMYLVEVADVGINVHIKVSLAANKCLQNQTQNMTFCHATSLELLWSYIFFVTVHHTGKPVY